MNICLNIVGSIEPAFIGLCLSEKRIAHRAAYCALWVAYERMLICNVFLPVRIETSTSRDSANWAFITVL